MNGTATNISLERKVTIGFGAAVVMLVVLAVVTYMCLTQLISNSGWDNHSREVLGSIARLETEITDVESAARGYAIAGDPIHLGRYSRAVDAVVARQIELRSLTSDNEHQLRRMDALSLLVRDKISFMQQLIDLRNQSQSQAVYKAFQSNEGARLMSDLRAVLGKMRDAETELLRERSAAAQSSVRRTIAVISLGTLMGFVLVAVARWMIQKDMAARRTSEAALRESEERNRFLAESMPQMVWSARPSGEFEYHNVRWLDFTGVDFAAAHAAGWNDVVHPDELRDCTDRWNLALKTGEPFEGEYRFKRAADGEYFWHLVRGVPQRDSDGRILRWVGTLTDIDHHKRAEEAIRDLNRMLQARTTQLEAFNKELQSFSYSVSHDLRAPLRSIDGFSQALLDDWGEKFDERAKDSLRRVRGATQRMGQLIDDMLSLARVTRSELRHETVDLSAAAGAIAADLQESQPNRVVEIVIQPGLLAHGDAGLLNVVLDNLIANAWKFTSRTKHPRIEIGATTDGAFFVRDNGAGFEMKYVAKLFGAFQRLHAMGEFPGTGIGLATAHRIVSRHGGKIWAEGAVDQGATFYFTIPANEASLPLAA